MNNTYILLMLVNTLTKAEKRYFHLCANLQNGDKVYLTLFNLIDANTSPEQLYTRFCQIQDGKSFETAVKHLYRVLLECLVRLREKQDVQTRIFNYISKAGVLFEREIFDEAFIELDKAKKLAITYENDSLLLLIRRTELKYLSALDFKTISEKQLVNKQMKINEVLKYARTLNQHTQLYDILKHRLINKGYIRSDKQKEDLNDLVLSELHLIANNSYQGFEAQKLHLLFQATYYLNSGNYKSAIRYYQELINLFNDNQHLILNPPIYYLSVLEGVLGSLRVCGQYDEIPYFLDKLKKLISDASSFEFQVNAICLLFQYELFPYLDNGDFLDCTKLMAYYQKSLYDKEAWLSPVRKSELLLYTALVHIGNQNYKAAKKYISNAIIDHNIKYQPLMRTIRLVRLIVYYEMHEYEFVYHESRSINRSLSSPKEHTFKTEHIILWFLNQQHLPVLRKDREAFWEKLLPEVQALYDDKYENQLLHLCDLTAWIEAKILKENLSDVLKRHMHMKELLQK